MRIITQGYGSGDPGLLVTQGYGASVATGPFCASPVKTGRTATEVQGMTAVPLKTGRTATPEEC